MSPRIGEQTDIRRVWSCTYSQGGTVERQTLLQGKSRLSAPARQGGADRGAASVLPESGRGIPSPSPGYGHGHGASRSRLIRRPRVPKTIDQGSGLGGRCGYRFLAIRGLGGPAAAAAAASLPAVSTFILAEAVARLATAAAGMSSGGFGMPGPHPPALALSTPPVVANCLLGSAFAPRYGWPERNYSLCEHCSV